MSQYFLDRTFRLAGLPGIVDIRGFGMLAGVEFDPQVVGMNGYELQKQLFDVGLHIKTSGNCAVLSPPFVCNKDNLDFMVDTLRAVLVQGR
jgi:beta-alanine--pyruvate transaminase